MGDKGNGTLETQGLNSMQTNATHSHVQVSENSSCDITRNPLPAATSGDAKSCLWITEQYILGTSNTLFN